MGWAKNIMYTAQEKIVRERERIKAIMNERVFEKEELIVKSASDIRQEIKTTYENYRKEVAPLIKEVNKLNRELGISERVRILSQKELVSQYGQG